jgi:hypothetical protein
VGAVRRIVWLLAVAVAAGIAATVALAATGFDPDPVRVMLLAAGLGAAVAVVLENRSEAPSWETRYDKPVVASGQDVRTSGLLRLVENNRTASRPDGALRERLRALTEQTLSVRHGLTADDPAARLRIGTHLRAVLDGPPRRLSAAELDACLDEIEGV